MSLMLLRCLGLATGSLTSRSSDSSSSTVAISSDLSGFSSDISAKTSSRPKIKELEKKMLRLMNFGSKDVNFDNPRQIDAYVKDLSDGLIKDLKDLGLHSSLRSKSKKTEKRARDKILTAESPEEFKEDLLERCDRKIEGLKDKIKECEKRKEKLKSKKRTNVPESDEDPESPQALLVRCRKKVQKYTDEMEKCRDDESRRSCEDKIKEYTEKTLILESEIDEETSEDLLGACGRELKKHKDSLQEWKDVKKRCKEISDSQSVKMLFGENSLPALSKLYFSIKKKEKGSKHRASSDNGKRGRKSKSPSSTSSSDDEKSGKRGRKSRTKSKSPPSSSNSEPLEGYGPLYLRPTGMRNSGNICFFNAAMQCLLSMPLFVGYFENNEFNEVNHPVSCAMRDLIAKYRGYKTFSPSSFITRLRRNMEIGRRLFSSKSQRQQDADEFLGALLNVLVNEGDTVIRQDGIAAGAALAGMFEIHKGEQTRCANECGYVNQHQNIDNPMRQHLYITEGRNVRLSIENYTVGGVVDFRAEGICGVCGRRGLVNEERILGASEYIIISLRRFVNRGGKKNRTGIRVNSEIEINGEAYENIGVVCHIGSRISGGHYRSECRRTIWYEFDDDDVSKTKRGATYNSSEPYILFYARRAASGRD